MTISIIVAIAENNIIGKDNRLIWHLSEDLKRFKQLTLGHTVIFGLNTFQFLPVKPLPGRTNIVISLDPEIQFEGAVTVGSPEKALEICKNEEEVFICGGASIYKQFLPLADKIYLTKVLHTFPGDTSFPEINPNKWIIESESDIFTDEKSKLRYQFLNFKKRNK
jgi:dihydrofolate reductase